MKDHTSSIFVRFGHHKRIEYRMKLLSMLQAISLVSAMSSTKFVTNKMCPYGENICVFMRKRDGVLRIKIRGLYTGI